MENLTVAHTILQQLGGRRFILMTGANAFVGDMDSLRFALPKAKDGINRVVVWLDPCDTYTVQFQHVPRFTMKAARTFSATGVLPTVRTVAEFSDIYCDQIEELFERQTGLYTRL